MLFYLITCDMFNAVTISYRTASDLEEWGWIDKTQKGVLKDLLISGNTDLQNALDKFRGGDTSLLQGMLNVDVKHRITLISRYVNFNRINKSRNIQKASFHRHSRWSRF